MNTRKPILCLDFDGVCHSYTSGWQGATAIPDPPVCGMRKFLEEAVEAFEVHIFSSRSTQEGGIDAMWLWFCHWAGSRITKQLHFPSEKPPAMISIDDRAITFTGTWPDVGALQKFKTWQESGKDQEHHTSEDARSLSPEEMLALNQPPSPEDVLA